MSTITTSFNDFGQDIPNNKSNLTITIYISADNNQTYFYNKTLSCTCNGSTQTASISMSKGGSVTQSFTYYDIYHNADGTKSVSWSWSVATGTSVLGTITRSGTQVLQTIPRASTISLSPSSIVLGGSTTITITRASSGFTHTLTWAIGNQSGTIATKTSNLTATFTSTKSLAEQFPNSKNGTCVISCITYSGDTQLGTSTANLTLQTEDTSEYQPTMGAMTLSFTDKFNDKVLNGITSATLQAGTTSTKYNASVSRYTLAIGSVSSSNATLNVSPINRTMSSASETIQATGQVIDSRGYVGNATPISFTLYKYTNPSVNTYSVQRCLQNGTIDNNGTYAKVYIKYTYANYGYSNSISVKKININETDYTLTATESTTDGVTTGEGSTIVGGGNLSNVNNYDYTITLTDAVGVSVVIDNNLPSGAKILNFKQGGLGMAIGKPSETDNLVDSDWKINSIGYQQNGTDCNIADSNYSTTETKIGTWLGNDLYRKVINFGALPDNTIKSVAHGISNLNRIIRVYGYAYHSVADQCIPISFSAPPATATTGQSTMIWITRGNSQTPNTLNMRCNFNMSGYSECYIVLEYTKTS